jgi:hypothetical protein
VSNALSLTSDLPSSLCNASLAQSNLVRITEPITAPSYADAGPHPAASGVWTGTVAEFDALLFAASEYQWPPAAHYQMANCRLRGTQSAKQAMLQPSEAHSALVHEGGTVMLGANVAAAQSVVTIAGLFNDLGNFDVGRQLSLML